MLAVTTDDAQMASPFLRLLPLFAHRTIGPMSTRIAKLILWTIAGCYAYGGFVHVLNILGFSGFDWPDAPLKWQVLDVAYLVLDIAVVVGLLARARLGYLALILAATSQIILYTELRDWIIDVPERFARTPDDLAYLDGLVLFHIVTLVLVGLASWLDRKPAGATSG